MPERIGLKIVEVRVDGKTALAGSWDLASARLDGMLAGLEGPRNCGFRARFEDGYTFGQDLEIAGGSAGLLLPAIEELFRKAMEARSRFGMKDEGLSRNEAMSLRANYDIGRAPDPQAAPAFRG